jgi:hypothetical protein
MAAEKNMAEANDVAAPRGEGAERVSERMRILLAETAEVVRRAAESYIDGQKEGAAKRLAGISEAMRQCARALEESENETIARYADRAAAQLEGASASLHERHWRDLMQETDRFARREPALYMLGALAAGFLGGWILLSSPDRPPSSTGPEPKSKDAEAKRAALRLP